MGGPAIAPGSNRPNHQLHPEPSPPSIQSTPVFPFYPRPSLERQSRRLARYSVSISARINRGSKPPTTSSTIIQYSNPSL